MCLWPSRACRSSQVLPRIKRAGYTAIQLMAIQVSTPHGTASARLALSCYKQQSLV